MNNDTPTYTRNKARGRPSAHLSEDEQQESKVDLDQDKKTIAHNRVGETRKPMQNNMRLSYTIRAGYYGRWVRDDNLKNAEDAWYEYVLVNGKKVTRQDPYNTLYLMELPEKLRAEDVQAKKEETRRRSKGLQVLKGDEYIPQGNQHVLQKDGDFDPFA